MCLCVLSAKMFENPDVSGLLSLHQWRSRYTERSSFYSNVATFEARAGRVRSNKIEVNVYAARLSSFAFKN